MYVLTESAVVAMIGALLGGLSLVAVSTFLIIVEGFNERFRGLRAR